MEAIIASGWTLVVITERSTEMFWRICVTNNFVYEITCMCATVKQIFVQPNSDTTSRKKRIFLIVTNGCCYNRGL